MVYIDGMQSSQKYLSDACVDLSKLYLARMVLNGA